MTCPRELNSLLEAYNVNCARSGDPDRAWMTTDKEGRMTGAILRGQWWPALAAAEWLRERVARS